jgi:hypothetical protein
MKIWNILIVGMLLLGLSSCFKEDTPIPAHPKGEVEEVIIPMTQYYVNQVYFNLATGEQVSMNKKDEFDLAFACADTGFIIRLNTASFMKAAQTTFTEFEQVTDTSGLTWTFDKSDGNPDSTALRKWINISGSDTTISNTVWIINRGINDKGFPVGLMKVKFLGLKNNTYQLAYAKMDNTEENEISIQKDPGFNYVQYKFGSETEDQIEPLTLNWDIVFTQYTTMLITDEGDPYPYLVTGTLINELGTYVAFDSTMVFNDIEIEDVLYLDYSKNQDAIGYEWKEIFGDINGGDFYYKARSNYNYIILSKTGIYYKLHFTGFYDVETGEKGYPTFEYQRL